MVKIKKKENSNLFTSVGGNQLKLELEKSQTCLRLSIHNLSAEHITRQSIGILVFISLNFIFFVFDVLPIQICIPIFFISLLIIFQIWSTVRKGMIIYHKVDDIDVASYFSETLVYVPSLGIQATVNFAMGTKSVFIPHEQIVRVFINEVIFRVCIII